MVTITTSDNIDTPSLLLPSQSFTPHNKIHHCYTAPIFFGKIWWSQFQNNMLFCRRPLHVGDLVKILLVVGRCSKTIFSESQGIINLSVRKLWQLDQIGEEKWLHTNQLFPLYGDTQRKTLKDVNAKDWKRPYNAPKEEYNCAYYVWKRI